MQQTVFIGCGAGFAGDRTDAAGPVVEALARSDGPRFLIFETLAERTLALAQLERRRDPGARLRAAARRAAVGPVLARCLAHGIRIVSNFGAANPRGAARAHRATRARSRLPRRRASPSSRATTSPARCRRSELAARETGGALLADGADDRRRQRLSRRRPDRRGARRRRRRSSSPAASPIRRWRSAR